jgi:hypothetical protein
MEVSEMRPMTEEDMKLKREYAEMRLQAYIKELKRQKLHMELYSSKEYLQEFGGYDMQECALRMRDLNGEIDSLEHELKRYKES